MLNAKKNKKQIIPLPFPVYFWTLVVFAFSGLADSVYLSISHYRVHTDFGYMSFCAISDALNCDTVSVSPYAVFLDVPVAVWGILGYSLLLLLLLSTCGKKEFKSDGWATIFFVALFFSVISIFLALISSVYIKSYCLMCIFSFGVNFLLLFFAWIIRQRFDSSGIWPALKNDCMYWWQVKSRAGAIFGSFILIVILLIIIYPKYWTFSLTLNADLPQGNTDDGHPWIGAEKPELTIIEFTDYQCFQCRKMHSYLRLLIAKNKDKVRLVHYHFPMDHKFNPIVKKPYHMGSGKLALIAIYATEKEKFWEVNDMLFSIDKNKSGINLYEIMKKAGLEKEQGALEIFNNKPLHDKLRNDINEGIKLKLKGTPGYVINGEVYQGQISSEILNRVLN